MQLAKNGKNVEAKQDAVCEAKKEEELESSHDYDALIPRFDMIKNIVEAISSYDWYIYYNNNEDYISSFLESSMNVDILKSSKILIKFSKSILDCRGYTIDHLIELLEYDTQCAKDIKKCIDTLQEHYSSKFDIESSEDIDMYCIIYSIEIDLEKVIDPEKVIWIWNMKYEIWNMKYEQ